MAGFGGGGGGGVGGGRGFVGGGGGGGRGRSDLFDLKTGARENICIQTARRLLSVVFLLTPCLNVLPVALQ